MNVKPWKSSSKAVWLSLGVILLTFCLPGFSQLNLGRILGIVTDESGGVMSGATVTVTDQDRGTSRVLKTEESGAFAAPSLIPGNYLVRVEAMGFNTAERKNVLVQVGTDARIDIVMKAGSQTQTVTVTETLPLVNTTSATLGGVIEGNEITGLPFLGRSYQSLLQFLPGVFTKPGGGAAGHSSNGLRTDGNNWLFEGIFSGGVRTGGSIINTNSVTGDGASVVPPDSIQDFGVSFQNKAEYGWRPGVASNVTIKSGTNSIHGTAVAVGQTSLLNARNPFNPPPNAIPELSYEQYGATVGGPIKKDKLFYYVAFEGMQQIQGVPTTHKVVTTALIANDATNSIPAAYLDMKSKGQIAAAAIDANGNVVNSSLLTGAQQLSAHLVGLGLFQTGVPTNGVFNYGFTASRDPNKNLVWKIDDHLNDKNNISGEYFLARDTEIGNSESAIQTYWFNDYYLTGNVLRANWTYLPNSTWGNEFHFGFDRKVENSWPAECTPGRAAAPPDYGFNTGLPTPCLASGTATNFAFPLLTISGFDNLGANATQSRRVEGYWALVDNVSHTFGKHNIKFGFETRSPYFSGSTAYAGDRGAVSFGTSSINAFTGATPLESFLMGVPSTASETVGDPTVLVRNHAFGIFVQDDWRLTPRLTLNLGLRYEYQTPLSEAQNKLAEFDPVLGLVQVGTNGLNSPWKSSVLSGNLQPRFGAVYDVTGKGTTIVRGAFGIYSSWPVWQVPVNIALLGSNPTAAAFYSQTGVATRGTGTIGSASVSFPTAAGPPPVPLLNWTLAGPVFPTGALKCGDGIGTNPGTCNVGNMDQHWSLPYVKEWTLAVQHAFTSTLALDLAYVGNRGTNLLGIYNMNQPTLGTNSKTREQQSRPYYGTFPWMGTLNDVTNKDFSNYNALQATLTQRPWHGLSSTVAYTYSHALDIANGDLNLAVSSNPLCAECDYGPTASDTRHRMTARVIYELPRKKSFGQVLEGWQLSSLVNLIGALPFNAADSSNDLSGTGVANQRWSLFGNATDFNSYGHFTSIPCYGVVGSTFGADPACTSVANVNLMPQACIAGANSLPTNPSVPSSDAKSTGLKSLGALGCYVSGNSVIVPPAQGTVGNMAKNMFRGAGLRLWDLSVRKKTKITERVSSEFQFDMYNVTNSPQFAGDGTSLVSPGTLGKASATPNVNGGNVVQGTGDARRYQFGLHLTF